MTDEMAGVFQQRQDGTWAPAKPIPPKGIVARVEFWLRARNRLPRVVAALARLDERGL